MIMRGSTRCIHRIDGAHGNVNLATEPAVIFGEGGGGSIESINLY
jgi:hypothetical protein